MPNSGNARPSALKERLGAERKKALHEFQKSLGLRFKSLELLNQALTHRSHSQDGPEGQANNERLEFLGDSVLGLSVAEYLYIALPNKSEGELARVKSFVVSEDCLSEIAFDLGLDRYLIMGRGEEHSGGRKKKAIMADALEALFGAYFLENDFSKAKKFLQRLLVPEIEKVLSHRHKRDYKTIIQEYVQKNSKSYPHYTLVKKTGPDHDKTFWVSASVCGIDYPEASGKSKKEAEQNAARCAYEAIEAAGGKEATSLKLVEGS